MAHDSAAFRLESAKTEMAAPHSMLTYIPPGIHRVIAQYVYASDLPNYRLASRMLAEMGAHRLFGTLPFHCSSASLARIEVFKKAEHLNKYCHTLAWDTNFWETPHVCDLDEWTRYFTARASFPKEYQPMGMSEKYSKDQLAELAYSRHEWDRYLKNVRDERITGSCSDELMPHALRAWLSCENCASSTRKIAHSSSRREDVGFGAFPRVTSGLLQGRESVQCLL